jgi:hypothetical protein
MPPNILIRVGADTAQAARELTNLNGPLSDVQTRGEKMSGAIRRAALPAAAALAAVGAAGLDAAKAAAEDQAGQEKLAAALQRTTGATAAQDAAVEAWITKQEFATGVSDDQLRPALAKLASATGDVGQAQSLLTLAMDVSAASGKSLEAATNALAKAHDGHAQSLAKLVPGLDQATLKSGDMERITAALADKVGGAAATAANTATGRYQIMSVRLAELKETIGAALLPIIGAMISAVSRATAIASEHTTAVKIVIGAVAALAAGILVANVALKAYEAVQILVRGATAAWAAGQWLLNAALTANPIGIVIVAVAALVAGIIIAYRHSETFRDAISKAWAILKLSPLGIIIGEMQALAGAVESVVGWISRIHWPSPPSWLGKIGGVVGGLFGAAPPSAPAIMARGLATPRSSGRPRGSGPSSASSGDGLTIIVNGATDPEGTARAIKRALAGHNRRQGALSLLANAGPA